ARRRCASTSGCWGSEVATNQRLQRVRGTMFVTDNHRYRQRMVERRRGHLWWKILLALLLVVVMAAVAGYWYMRPLLLTGTGYAAHNACAVANISERTDPAEDLPPNPLVPYLRTSTGDGSVTA